MRKTLTATIAFLLILATALPATADPVSLGDRKFQRAWRMYVTRSNDKAVGHFKDAAATYAEALRHDPPLRTMKFQSNMVEAGIAMYFAGEYDLCIKTLENALGEKDKIWDAALFIALAQGKKGDKEASLKAFDRFLDSNPSQRYITTQMSKVLPGVKDGSVPLADAIASIEKETQHQFVENVARYNGRDNVIPSTDSCNGAYWWRQNSTPCSRGLYHME